MKEYEGPVFQNGQHKKREASKFQQASQRSTARRSFKPVSESRQQPYETAYQENGQVRLDYLRQGQVQRESDVEAPTPNEVYDIPFKRHQQDSPKLPERMITVEDRFAQQSKRNEGTPRMVYEPAFKRDMRQTEIVPEEVERWGEGEDELEETLPFQPTQLPKPYRDGQRLVEVDLQTRELAKRLIKSPDSFLLFEEE